MKWGFIDPKKNTKPVYLICNADESEPGTFKDKQIMYKDPHQLLEGMAIACFANNVHLAYIYIRGEFTLGAKILEKAIAEAKAKNFLGKNILGAGYDLEIYVHRGAGAYICGEETGLIESLEGKRPYPRIKPPYFPAVLGLYMCPTIVNNVETLCAVKHIVDMGGAAYAKLGKPGNTGTRMLCVSGDVEKPGYYEYEVGKITIGELLNDVCGGIKGGRKLKSTNPRRLLPQKSCVRASAIRSRLSKPTVRCSKRRWALKTSRSISIRSQPQARWPVAAVFIVMDETSRHGRVPREYLHSLLRARIMRPMHALAAKARSG